MLGMHMPEAAAAAAARATTANMPGGGRGAGGCLTTCPCGLPGCGELVVAGIGMRSTASALIAGGDTDELGQRLESALTLQACEQQAEAQKFRSGQGPGRAAGLGSQEEQAREQQEAGEQAEAGRPTRPGRRRQAAAKPAAKASGRAAAAAAAAAAVCNDAAVDAAAAQAEAAADAAGNAAAAPAAAPRGDAAAGLDGGVTALLLACANSGGSPLLLARAARALAASALEVCVGIVAWQHLRGMLLCCARALAASALEVCLGTVVWSRLIKPAASMAWYLTLHLFAKVNRHTPHTLV